MLRKNKHKIKIEQLALLAATKTANAPTLFNHLTKDIIQQLLSVCDLNTISALSQVNRRLHKLVNTLPCRAELSLPHGITGSDFAMAKREMPVQLIGSYAQLRTFFGSTQSKLNHLAHLNNHWVKDHIDANGAQSDCAQSSKALYMIGFGMSGSCCSVSTLLICLSEIENMVGNLITRLISGQALPDETSNQVFLLSTTASAATLLTLTFYIYNRYHQATTERISIRSEFRDRFSIENNNINVVDLNLVNDYKPASLRMTD
tara:strand:+ start:1392 stop:2174 length:783 start_codon:yes stop_codon:yes gene_type:complete